MRIVTIFTNGTSVSEKEKENLIKTFEKNGFAVRENCSPDSELLVCVGGDGAFLRAVHTYHFPPIPIVGVNTGHLGFFQEISPDDPQELERFIQEYKEGRYTLQPLNTVQAVVTTKAGNQMVHRGLNEIVIRGSHS